MARRIVLSFATLLLTGAHPYEVGTIEALTPTRQAEAIFPNEDGKAVASKLASACMDRSWSVNSQTETLVLCETPPNQLMQTVQNIGGGPRGAHLRGFIRFSIVMISDGVRVQAQRYTEQANAFGQIKSFHEMYNFDEQEILISNGGHYPPGTSFKGVDLGARGFINRENDVNGWKISKITTGGAADTAGLKIGDRIVGISGKKLSDDASSLRWRLGKFKPGQTIVATLERDGVVSQVTFEARAAAPIPRTE